MKLLLASRSPARRRMLEAAGVPFAIAPAGGDEDAAKARLRGEGLAPLALAGALAEYKARTVEAAPHALVLGADQTLECADGTMLDKPASRADAAAQLRLLAGKAHHLHAAAAIVEDGETVWRASESVALAMRPLGDDAISAYLDDEYEAVRGNVGAYRIEGPGVQLFDSIQGSHFAILGLPLLPLLRYLRERGA